MSPSMSNVTILDVIPTISLAKIVLIQSVLGYKEVMAPLSASISIKRGHNCWIFFSNKLQDTSSCICLTGDRVEFIVILNRKIGRFYKPFRINKIRIGATLINLPKRLRKTKMMCKRRLRCHVPAISRQYKIQETKRGE